MTASAGSSGQAAITVIGEALIDLVENGDDEPRLARPGGSPYNVAIGLARLRRHICFAGRFSHDPLGTVLRRHAERSGVDLTLLVQTHEPTTVALVELGADGGASYQFGVDGTADFRWTEAELHSIPDSMPAVHFGSLASWLPPGDALIARRIGQLRDHGAAVTYDPNIRPHLQPDPMRARAQAEAGMSLAHLVKTSEEDLAYLYPGESVDAVAARWLTAGPSVVVVTLGGNGARSTTAAGSQAHAPLRTEVMDTVGAGDAFMSGLLDGLLGRDMLTPAALSHPDQAGLASAIDRATRIASITCSRAGSNPPRLAELD